MPSGLWSVLGRIAQIESSLRELDPPPPVVKQPAQSFADTLAQVSRSASTTGASSTSRATTTSRTQYDELINGAASRYGLDPDLLHAVIQAESDYDPNCRSRAGAAGLTQLMPGTARRLGVEDVHDPAQSIDGGAHYLREMLDMFDGSTELALAAYNAGPGAVSRYGGIPPYAETQAYVPRVLGYMATRKQEGE